MNSGKTIFAQLMEFLSHYEFQNCVQRYGGDHKVKTFSCWDQFLCMAFAQLTYREGLRDIEACLRVANKKLYHMGFRGLVSRNTLANANRVRDWRIYADFAQVLIAEARELYSKEDFGLELEETVYALDSSTIDLCLTLFPSNQEVFGNTKNAVKTQIWIAISIYVLVAIIKKRMKLDRSLYTILQILSVTLFEKTPILQALSTIDSKKQEDDGRRQLDLFD